MISRDQTGWFTMEKDESERLKKLEAGKEKVGITAGGV